MNKAVEILLTSATGAFPTISPTGVQITYPIGDIPTAVLELAPSSLDLFCDFEKYRRTRVSLLVRTINGCIHFDGLIDGLSMSQSVGGMSIQLVIKSTWQVLKEIDSRIPGYSSNSDDIFKQTSLINLNSQSGAEIVNGTFRFSKLKEVGFDIPVIKGMVELVKVFLYAYQDVKTLVSEPNFKYALVRVAEALKVTHINLALEKMNKIVTVFAENTRVTLGHYLPLSGLLATIAQSRGSMFDLLLKLLDLFECTLVIGNEYAYIVPKIGFLRMTHANVGLRQLSSTPNVVYPAQYNSFSFNDSGYMDIRAMVLRSPQTLPIVNTFSNAEIGYYIDPYAYGGMLVQDVPEFVAIGGSVLHSSFQSQVKRSVSAAATNTGAGTAAAPSKEESATEREAKRNAQEKLKINQDKLVRDSLLKYCNEWAQIKYYQAKYSDRVGNFTTLFNPNFAPGAVGQLYTRHPGTYIDFFVTGVTHSLRLAPEAQGEAITTVSFNSGRIGANALATGVNTISYFNYSAATSLDYARRFVNDVSSI
jgi:hypothetical protein